MRMLGAGECYDERWESEKAQATGLRSMEIVGSCVAGLLQVCYDVLFLLSFDSFETLRCMNYYL